MSLGSRVVASVMQQSWCEQVHLFDSQTTVLDWNISLQPLDARYVCTGDPANGRLGSIVE